MKSLLEQSQKNYDALPSYLRSGRVRSRTHSRASPYPRPSSITSMEDITKHSSSAHHPVLQSKPVNSNIAASGPNGKGEKSSLFSFLQQGEKGSEKVARTRSTTRRTVLGMSKRQATSNLHKENSTVGPLMK